MGSAFKRLLTAVQVTQLRTKVIAMMIRLVFRTICLFVIIDYVKGAKIGKQTSLSRVSRQLLPSCDEQICKDCRGSCDGCNKCPLCAILAKTCAEGKKKLVFEGDDVCAKCKYCKDRRNAEQIVSLESLKQPV